VVAVCNPAIIFNNVDLPAPFFPTNAILSLGFITALTPLNKGLAEYSTPIACKVIIPYNFDLLI
jgi:hypothetical protein